MAVDNLNLLAHRLLVDGGEDGFHKFARHAHLLSRVDAALHQVVVAAGLNDGHRVLLFVLADFAGHAHTFVKEFEQFVVDAVNLLA